MNQQKLDWQKVAKWFIGFAIASILFNYTSRGVIDYREAIGMPLIAVTLMYFIDRKWFLKENN